MIGIVSAELMKLFKGDKVKNHKILICDDNEATHEMLSVYFDAEGMGYYSVFNGRTALKKAKDEKFDLIILDVMMPGLLGTDVCREIRKFSEVPIIMLSGKGEEIDRILGLELGADDYVVKPFSPREVMVRIKKILKRRETKKTFSENKITLSNLSIDLDRYEVKIAGEKIVLTPKELEIFYYLVANQGQVFLREQLLDKIWGYDYYGDTRAVDTQIKRLRKKLYRADNNFEIKSIYGVGYKFEIQL